MKMKTSNVYIQENTHPYSMCTFYFVVCKRLRLFNHSNFIIVQTDSSNYYNTSS